MKSVTIRNLDDELTLAIKQMAESMGISQNEAKKKLLREAIDLRKEKKKNDFSRFSGVWTQEEAKTFDESISVFNQIDKEVSAWTQISLI